MGQPRCLPGPEWDSTAFSRISAAKGNGDGRPHVRRRNVAVRTRLGGLTPFRAPRTRCARAFNHTALEVSVRTATLSIRTCAAPLGQSRLDTTTGMSMRPATGLGDVVGNPRSRRERAAQANATATAEKEEPRVIGRVTHRTSMLLSLSSGNVVAGAECSAGQG